VPAFTFMREAGGLHMPQQEVRGNIVRWTFDLSKSADTPEETVLAPAGDFPRTADKDMMVDYDVAYFMGLDFRFGPPIISGPVGGGFNTISRLELKTGKITSHVAGPQRTLQEHFHVPSKKKGHEGYLGCIADLQDQNQAELQIFEAQFVDKGPIARIRVPLRLRSGVHGNWVPASAL